MNLGLKGWAIVGLAVCVGVLAVSARLSMTETRAQKAEAKVVVIDAARRTETVRADTGAVVARAADSQAAAQVRVERQTVTVIRQIEASPDASTPIPSDLARAWVSGLRRMCDEAPGACADGPADRAHGAPGVQPLPAGDAAGRGRFEPR
jgi:hypothetical protein